MRLIPLHISILRRLLKRKPASSEKTKNSQIQFHSKPAKTKFREGYPTLMACTMPFSGNPGSPEMNTRSHQGPRSRTGDTRARRDETTTCFENVWPETLM